MVLLKGNCILGEFVLIKNEPAQNSFTTLPIASELADAQTRDQTKQGLPTCHLKIVCGLA